MLRSGLVVVFLMAGVGCDGPIGGPGLEPPDDEGEGIGQMAGFMAGAMDPSRDDNAGGTAGSGMGAVAGSPGMQGDGLDGGMPALDGGDIDGGTDAGADAAVDAGMDAGGTDPALAGFWVWKQQIEDDAVTLEITEADLEFKVGPAGWPDCPSGILCLHYGMHRMAIGPGGEFWYVENVKTGSDFERVGTVTTEGDLATVHQDTRYSCAHPEDNETIDETEEFRFEFDGEDLRVSVKGFGGPAPFEDAAPAEPSDWIVFKRVLRADFYDRYDVRLCQDKGAPPLCNGGCAADNMGRP